MKFEFTKEMIKVALKANGWHTLWHEENWVHDSATNPDYEGVNIETAFRRLLRECNLL